MLDAQPRQIDGMAAIPSLLPAHSYKVTENYPNAPLPQGQTLNNILVK